MTLRRLALVAALSLPLGCKKPSPPGGEATPPPAQAGQPAGKAEQPAAEQGARPSAEPEAKPSEITEPLVARYVVFEKEYLEAWKAAIAELGEGSKKADKQEGLRQAVTIGAAIEKSGRMNEEGKKRALQKSGLTAEEEAQLEKAVSTVITSRAVWKKGENGFADTAKRIKTTLATAPPTQKAVLEEQLKQLQAAQDSLREVPEARKEYGDKAVDAILQHEAELTALWEQVMNMSKK